MLRELSEGFLGRDTQRPARTFGPGWRVMVCETPRVRMFSEFAARIISLTSSPTKSVALGLSIVFAHAAILLQRATGRR